MAAPDRIDLDPSSCSWIPYLFPFPMTRHVVLSVWTTFLSETSKYVSAFGSPSAHTGVSSFASGLCCLTIWTALPHANTGHRALSVVRCWDRRSIFVPFFWSTKQMVTK